MNQEKIGSLIKKIRKDNKLTQQDFAKNMELLTKLLVNGKMEKTFPILHY